MNTRSPLVRLFAAFVLATSIASGQLLAQATSFTDAINDINPGIATAGGTLDIVSMEVSDSPEDVILRLTVNGDISAVDWGNFMIGIANQKTPGTITGNGWGRPINLNAGVINGVTYGMNRWIGSWVNSGGGAQVWAYDDAGATWSQTGAAKAISLLPGGQSVITYILTKQSLGVATGDTIVFDAYSSGGGSGDSSIDALSNPNIAVTDWGVPYTSATPFISSYTLSNSALPTTQNITFRVDMNYQTTLGNFDPSLDLIEVLPVDNTAFVRTDMTEVANQPGVYAATVSVTGLLGVSVNYRFNIAGATDVPETLTRSFTMPSVATELPVYFFNNIEGNRDVTFSVDMSVQVAGGFFDTNTGLVEVRGPFNGWAGTALANTGSNAIYTGTVTNIGGLSNQVIQYKFWATGPEYESFSDNRSFNLAFTTNGLPTPAQVISPTPYFNNVSGGRDVTFTVDLTVMEALGRFTDSAGSPVKVVGNFNNWDTGGTTYQLTDPDTNGTFTGTFFILGNESSTLQYKFFSPGLVYYRAADPNNAGYEIVNQTNAFQNRTATLSSNGVAQVIPSVQFSDQLFGIMDTANFPLPASSLTNFSTTQGTPSAAQSVAVSGLQLSNNVLATAPTGFQVSLDGTNYFPSVNLVPTNGTLGSVPLFTRVASTASPGVQTNLTLSLTSVGSQFTDLRVGSSVEATAETFSNWSGGAALTPALQLEYAIGGSTSPTATNGVPSVTTVTSNTLSITAVVRTNDPTLTVNGQSLIDLAVGPWTTNNVTMTPEVTAAPEGCQVQTFSTPRGEDSKKFLRLQTTLPAEPQR